MTGARLTGVLTDAAAAVASMPAAAKAALVAPRRARQHPLAREVQALVHEGWRITTIEISETPVRAVVELSRDRAVRRVADNDLAFAAYAAALHRSDPPTTERQ